MADVGGGHRAVAQALIKAVEYLAPNRWRVEMVDFLDRCTPFSAQQAARLYRMSVNHAAPLYGRIWHRSDRTPRLAGALVKMCIPLAKRRLSEILHQKHPDIVVSVYPFASYFSVQAIASLDRHVPFVTVVTDLVAAHTLWFSPGVDLCVVPSEGARERALRAGVPKEKVLVVGFPVSAGFVAQRGIRGEVRRKLGLDAVRRTILLVGGGEGMGRLEEMAHRIASSGLDVQLLVVAGRNERLRRRLESAVWQVQTLVYGFVTNMPELMRAADLIVTKAGPSTVIEALTCGLPLILSGFIPGQEESNVQLVVEGGAGLLAETPEKVVACLRDLLRPGNDALDRMAASARCLARPTAALDIARLIFGLVTESTPQSP
jgi:1,2-diacylglycerol 3-beta-galactosyltransferase